MRKSIFTFITMAIVAFTIITGCSNEGQHQAAFRPEAISAHVRFLADDLLEGRFTGTRGYDLAAAYVATQFEAYGLEPAGDDSTYYQQVPFRSATRVPGAQSLVITSKGKQTRLVELKDFVLRNPDRIHMKSSLAADVVFAGYGISEPAIGHDDYANIDAQGKVVAMFARAPGTFAPNELAYYASTSYKMQTAVDHGAVGVIYLLTPANLQRFPFQRFTANPQRPAMAWQDEDGGLHPGWPQIQGLMILSRPGADALFRNSPVSFTEAIATAEAGKPQSFDLKTKLRMSSRSTHQEFSSPNVLAVLRGSDPVLKDEYVVYTAHLDHVGTGDPVNGDPIYNGAHDNAVGTAMMLEVARNFAATGTKPKRSIIFLAVTGEERGLLGSAYFANNPTVPQDQIVANLNLDMFLLLFPMTEVVAFGAEHSSLGAVAERAAKKLGIKLTPDPMPEQTIFVRSDQYSFVKRGIPALYIIGGLNTDAPGFDGPALIKEWRKNSYHKPRDEYDPAMHFESGAKAAHFNFLIGLEVANTAARPTWNEGDFFLEKFGK